MTRIGLIILLLSLWATTSSHAAIAIAQSRLDAGSISEDSRGLAYATPVSSGSTLVIICAVLLDTHSVTAPTISDTLTNTWTIRINQGASDPQVFPSRLYIATALSASAGTPTVTCNAPGNAFYTLVIVEVTGAAAATPIDQVASCGYECNQPSNTALSGTTAATTQASELVLAAVTDSGAQGSLTAQSPCALLQEETDYITFVTINVCSHLISSMATQQRTWLGSQTDFYYAAGIITIKEAVVAPTTGRRTVFFP